MCKFNQGKHTKKNIALYHCHLLNPSMQDCGTQCWVLGSVLVLGTCILSKVRMGVSSSNSDEVVSSHSKRGGRWVSTILCMEN